MSAQEATFRLAHIVPFSTKYGIDIPADLVLNALLLSNEPQSAGGIAELIAEHLGCTVGRDQVAEKLVQLHDRRLVLPAKGGYILSHEAKKTLEAQRSDLDDQAALVARRWIGQIGQKYPDLTPSDHQLLVEDLGDYLNALFLKHGVESVNLIQETGTSPVDQVLVPARTREVSGHLTKIEEIEFPEFLGSEDPEIIRFLIGKIDQAVRYLTTVIDPQVLTRLNKHLSGKILFLDSSAVYRLLNLQGQERFESVSQVIKLCHEAGFDVRVNRKTLDELRRRLKYDSGVLRKYPVPTNLAAVGVRYLTAENYVSTYWRVAKEKKLAVEDFVDYYEHFDQVLLDQYGVEVESDERPLSPEEAEMVNYWISQLGLINREDAEYSKSLSALEHDAYNIALIDSMVGPSKKFLDSPAWFVTTDRTLVQLQREHHERRHSRPFCVMPSQLMQLLRFITPKEGAYDRAFLSLFARSYIPSENGLPNEMIHEILGRIAQYRGTPSLAEKVLGDALFVRRFKQAADDSERDEVVHDTLIEKAKEMEVELKEKEALAAAAQSQATSFQQSASELSLVAEEKTRLLQQAEEKIAKVEQGDAQKGQRILELEKLLNQAEVARQVAERREQERQQNEQQVRARRVRIMRGFFGAVILVLFCVPFMWYLRGGWIDVTKPIKVLVFSLPFAGVIAGAYIAFDDAKAARVSAIVGGFLGALAALGALL